MKGIALSFCFAALLCLQNVLALQVDYIDSYKTGINLRTPSAGYLSSGILKSHNKIFYPDNLSKTFNVTAPTGYSLVVSIRLIDLRPSVGDQLTIFTYNGLVKPLIFTNTGFFKNRSYYPNEDLTFFAPKGQVGIKFTTGTSYFSTYDGFELTYTAVATGIFCNIDDFFCNNGRCIAYDLKCDDHNHCGDQSSLKNCKSNNGGSMRVGIGLGTVFLIIAAACGIFIIIRRARRASTDTETIITSYPPSTNLQTHPPAYPQPGPYYPQPETNYPQPGIYYPPPPPAYSPSQGVVNPTYH